MEREKMKKSYLRHVEFRILSLVLAFIVSDRSYTSCIYIFVSTIITLMSGHIYLLIRIKHMELIYWVLIK